MCAPCAHPVWPTTYRPPPLTYCRTAVITDADIPALSDCRSCSGITTIPLVQPVVVLTDENVVTDTPADVSAVCMFPASAGSTYAGLRKNDTVVGPSVGAGTGAAVGTATGATDPVSSGLRSEAYSTVFQSVCVAEYQSYPSVATRPLPYGSTDTTAHPLATYTASAPVGSDDTRTPSVLDTDVTDAAALLNDVPVLCAVVRENVVPVALHRWRLHPKTSLTQPTSLHGFCE